MLSGILLGFVTLASSTVAAQNKPRSLVPLLGEPEQSRPANTSESSPEPAPAAQKQKQVIEGSRIEGSVVVQKLGGLDAASVGILDASTGDLGSSMWQGTSSSRVATLIQHLPVSSSSPEMQKLLRRLLLTAAAIPRGSEEPTELMQLRLNKLRDAGLVVEASQLVQRVPASKMSSGLERTAVDLLLLEGKNEQACKKIEGMTENTPDFFWEKASVFCNVLSGNMSRAELGVSLLNEDEGTDSLFFGLFDRLVGGNSKLQETDQVISPLHFAMMKEAGLSLSYEQAEKAGFDLLWALAKQEIAEKNDRLRAAYVSLAVGSMPAGLVRQLIIAGALANDDDDAAIDLGHMAGFFRQAASEKDPMEKARLIGELWAAGEQDGTYFAAAGLSLPLLKQISAVSLDGDFELDALRVLLAAGDSAEASLWERSIRRSALRGTARERDVAGKKIALADAYMLISGTPGIARWTPSAFDPSAFVKGPELEQGANVGMLLSILEIFGEKVPDELWSAAFGLGQVPQSDFSNKVIEKNLEISANNGRVGETVALSLALLGEGGPAMLSVNSLSAVLTSLQKIGLTDEARHLALEAAILRDL